MSIHPQIGILKEISIILVGEYEEPLGAAPFPLMISREVWNEITPPGRELQLRLCLSLVKVLPWHLITAWKLEEHIWGSVTVAAFSLKTCFVPKQFSYYLDIMFCFSSFLKGNTYWSDRKQGLQRQTEDSLSCSQICIAPQRSQVSTLSTSPSAINTNIYLNTTKVFPWEASAHSWVVWRLH